jgi:hypothetical protein
VRAFSASCLTLIVAEQAAPAYTSSGTKGIGAESDRERARRYRDGADEYRRNAAETKDLAARVGFMQVANFYDLMADAIEHRLDDDDNPPNSN